MKIIFNLILSVVLSLLTVELATAYDSERILDFHSDIIINEDTSLDVTETIKIYSRGGSIKHGIKRDFPTIYTSKRGIKRVRGFEVVSVKLDGSPVAFKENKIRKGVQLQIGSASILLSAGAHTYTIRYKTSRQLGYLSEYDELYWNVTGNGWSFNIDKASATVTLPPRAKCIGNGAWTGKTRSRENNVKITRDPNDSNKITFTTTKPLAIFEGLTFKTTFSKGALIYKHDQDSLGSTLDDNPSLLLLGACFILITLYLFIVWIKIGRDPKSKTIIPRYDAPEDLSAAAIRQIFTMKFDRVTSSAAILGLAAKGALSIKDYFGEYTLIKQYSNQDLTEDEAIVYHKLFRTNDTITLSNSHHSVFSDVVSALKKSLKENSIPRYYSLNSIHTIFTILLYLIACIVSLVKWDNQGTLPGIILFTFSFLAIKIYSEVKTYSSKTKFLRFMGWFTFAALCVLIFYISKSLIMGSIHGIILFATVAVILLFRHLNKAYTKEGRAALDHILGLRNYLRIGEKQRLNLEHPPERTPEHFEHFLPYALALGVEQAWAEQFHDVFTQSIDPETGKSVQHYPSYYSSNMPFDSNKITAVTAAIGASLAANIAAAAVNPSYGNGGGGGGGFSSGGGGGFSGGGGGGGGGSGW